MKCAWALAAVLLSPLAVCAITINTVPVGNAGNGQDFQSNGLFGRVTYDYRMGATEVTNAQYVTFLNTVAASDAHNLYSTDMGFQSRGGIVRSGVSGSYTYSVKPDVSNGGPGGTNYTYGDKPVVFVSWSDALRFANWVNNGATATASTETGSYALADSNITRKSGAVWFLPTEDEWYKAAYYDPTGPSPVYNDYPTKTNAVPNHNLPSADTGNSANFFQGGFTQDESYPTTAAGAYTSSKSAYNTFDQGGNVWEWTETVGSNSTLRIRRGGAFDTDSTTLNASHREGFSVGLDSDSVGFRLATIAVPGDYNANGIVDAADFAVWRKYLNQSVTLPNDSTQGMVSLADYDVWRAHFGQTPATATPGAGLSQHAVPEPCALTLLGALAALSMLRRESTRKFAIKIGHARS